MKETRHNADTFFFTLKDKMEQLKTFQTMDGITKLKMDWLKTPQQIFVAGKPKRQRPTHQGYDELLIQCRIYVKLVLKKL